MTETTVASAALPPAVERFVVAWGEMGEVWGVNRSVSQILRERIAAGIYEPGARVPGVADLAGEFGVSVLQTALDKMFPATEPAAV